MASFQEIIELRGHLIDSLILPKVLDDIIQGGGSFRIVELKVGQRPQDQSYARIEVEAPSSPALQHLLGRVRRHGARVMDEGDVALVPAPQDGVFPEGFYVTTNLPTWVRWQGEWLSVADTRMDCGICLDPTPGQAATRRFAEVRAGEFIIVGHRGVRVDAPERSTPRNVFEFMGSAVSSEKPKSALIAQIAQALREVKGQGHKIVLVLGPVVVHSGAVGHVVRLIELGYANKLFAGNGLAAHDIELAWFGTSLGVDLDQGLPVEEGHENHLRAINRVRHLGGIGAACAAGELTSGILYTCWKHGVEVVLAGSIRDDGPLPEVITDTVMAQQEMGRRLLDVGLALMVGSTLHSVAVGNLLPSRVKTVCVDINPAVVTKLTDRGSFQTIGLVSDAEPFLRELVAELEKG